MGERKIQNLAPADLNHRLPITNHHSQITNYLSPGEKSIKLILTFTIPGRLEKPILFLLLFYRRLRFGYPFRRIPLTQGKFAIVDSEDYHRLRKYKWYAHKAPHTFYAIRSLTNGKTEPRKNQRMHELIINTPQGLFVDHINHDGLDNRKKTSDLQPTIKTSGTEENSTNPHAQNTRALTG